MAATYRTKQGDRLDVICHKFYGATNGVPELVLEANRGLGDLGASLASGLIIQLPDLPVTSTKSVRLWD